MRLFTVTKHREVFAGASFKLFQRYSLRSRVLSPKDEFKDGHGIAISNELLFSKDVIVMPQVERVVVMKASLVRTEHERFILMPTSRDEDSRDALVWVAPDYQTIMSWCGHELESSPGFVMDGLARIAVGQEVTVSPIIETTTRVLLGTITRQAPDTKNHYKLSFDGTNVLVDGKPTDVQMLHD